jgi:uncharacterized HAD superfamily protein
VKKFKKSFCFDIDGVICKTNKSFYKKSKPNHKVINLINKLYVKGNEIKIFTSRYMGRNNENTSLVIKKYHKKTDAILKKWGLRYHKLILGKPSYDVFIDDKAFGFKKNWLKDFRKKYKKITED